MSSCRWVVPSKIIRKQRAEIEEKMSAAETLKAKGVEFSISRNWEIADMSLFIPARSRAFGRSLVDHGYIEIVEIEPQEPIVSWRWFDKESKLIIWEHEREVIRWMQEILAAALDDNYMSVVLLNHLTRTHPKEANS